MKQTIRLYDIFGSDLFSRSRASQLLSNVDINTDEVTLDFTGVNFISRSFADELCNIIEDNKHLKISLSGQNSEVDIMLSRVREGRAQERKRGIARPRMYEFNNMESLSSFLLNM
jgi:hypothetical protein